MITITFTSVSDTMQTGVLSVVETGRTVSTFALQANGIPPVSATPDALVFAATTVGQRSAGQWVTLRNASAEPITFASEGVQTNFEVFSSCGGRIEPSATCSLIITFVPSGGTGTTAQLANSSYTIGLRNASSSYQTNLVIGLSATFIPAANAAAPRMPRVVNSASFAIDQPVAPNSIATIFGTELSTTTVANSSATLPTNLGGVTLSVRDDAGTPAQAARLFFVSPGQVNFLMPALSPNATLALITDHLGRTYNVRLAPVSPGIYMASPTTVPAGFYDRYLNGRPVDLNRSLVSDGPPLQAAVIPRNFGEQVFLLLYGTGIRGVRAGAVTATIGGVNIPVTFAGAQQQFAGLDQVNLGPILPATPSGEVLLRLSFNGLPANEVRVRLQ